MKRNPKVDWSALDDDPAASYTRFALAALLLLGVAAIAALVGAAYVTAREFAGDFLADSRRRAGDYRDAVVPWRRKHG